MSLELDALVAEVAEAEDAETKAIAFIEGILAQLVAAGTDPVKLTELKDGLKATTDALVAEFAKVPAPPEA